LALEDSLEAKRLVNLSDRIYNLAGADVVTEYSFHLTALALEDLLDEIWIP